MQERIEVLTLSLTRNAWGRGEREITSREVIACLCELGEVIGRELMRVSPLVGVCGWVRGEGGGKGESNAQVLVTEHDGPKTEAANPLPVSLI